MSFDTAVNALTTVMVGFNMYRYYSLLRLEDERNGDHSSFNAFMNVAIPVLLAYFATKGLWIPY